MRTRAPSTPLLLPVLLFALAAPALGERSFRFLPRSLDSGATFELTALSELDDNETASRRLRWTDDFLRGKLTLFSNGFFYHPRLLRYELSLTGALKQEEYETTAGSGRTSKEDSGFEYKVRLRLLPEHPYSFELFSLRWEPLERDRAATQRDNLATSHGADFRYERKPYFLRAQYSDNTFESNETSSEVQRLGVDAQYFKDYRGGNQLSLRASFSPERFRDSSGLDGTSRDALASSSLTVGRVDLYAAASDTLLEQGGGFSSRFESEQSVLHGRLGARLPGRFRSSLSYRRSESRTLFDGSSGLREQENLDRDLEFDLVHQLYDSVRSTYTHRRNERFTDTGDSLVRADSLSVRYTKTIPGGRFEVGYGRGRSRSENLGQAAVANEPHPAVALPGSFTLAHPNADRASLAVFLRSPISPFETILLREGEHYTLAELGDTIEVTVLGLPPRFALPGAFNLLVSYVLLAGDFELESENESYHASLHLFDNLLTPYYSFFTTGSNVVEGSFPGRGLDTTRTTYGLRLQPGPVRIRVEYQDVEWEISPYEAWIADLQVVAALGAATNLYLSGAYQSRDYPRGRSAAFAEPLTEETRSASLNLQQKLFSRTLLLSLGGTYSRTTGFSETEAVSYNTSLSWKVGRLDLSAGATYSSSEAGSPTLLLSTRERRYYFLRLRRELF